MTEATTHSVTERSNMKIYSVLAALFLCAVLVMAIANFIYPFVGGSNDLSGQVAYLSFITGNL